MSRKTHLSWGIAVGIALFGLQPGSALAELVSVFPAPGTRVASNSTTISFRGIKPKHLGKLVVIGSKTGRHHGKLRRQTDGHGVSFIPNRKFAVNEVVRVGTHRRIRLARHGDFRFRIGNFRSQAARPPHKIPHEGEFSPNAVTFHSRPTLRAPRVTIDTPAHNTAPGYVFIAPKSSGPMILDNTGNLIWHRRGRTTDFRVQTFKGHRVMTWWQGPFTPIGVTKGTFLIFSSHYRRVKRVRAGNGDVGGLHEFNLTPRGTALLTAYRGVKKDLRRFGGPRNGTVLDSIVQEVDVRTGLVVWEWHSLGNVALKNSMVPPPETVHDAWDYFHVNSVNEDADGNLLVSSRNTSAVYRVNKATGNVMWRLGGKRSNFKKLGKATRTAWQHDAMRQADGTISVFDNGAAPPVHKASRALFLRLVGKGRTVRVEKAFTHPKGLLAGSQGSVQLLPNGNVFVGWGSEPYFTEFSPSGEVLFDGHFLARNSSYRSYRFAWTGRPGGRPAIASQALAGGMVSAWASWNGDTEVASWRLLAGPDANSLSVVGSAPRSGFETAVTASTTGPFVAMEGLDASGGVLGRSAVTRVGEQSR